MTGASDCFSKVPATLDEALDPRWLSRALAGWSGSATVEAVECVEVLRTVATKARFTARFSHAPDSMAFCLKGLLDVDEVSAKGGSTCVRESDFYDLIAPHVAVRVPTRVATVIDRERQQSILIMRDLVADGAAFGTALEPLSADDAAASLDQIARLHAGSALLDQAPWITRRIAALADSRYVTTEQLQAMLDGPRGEGLPNGVRNAERLVAGLRALAERDGQRPQSLVHGDAHAGNIFRTTDGPGLIDWQLLQRGGWALDVAYHIAAVLDVDVAEREERALLDHYLETAQALGCAVPDRDEAWRQYRESLLYGYYLWAITRRVDPPIITLFVQRLGSAVARHDSHRLVGLPPAR
ncbi:MAG: aminoglycoside phosphotransferase family protein [Novosphingobium sp.]